MSSFVQRKKKLILGIGIPVLVIVIAFFAFRFYISMYHFEYIDMGFSREFSDEEKAMDIISECGVRYPQFEDPSIFDDISRKKIIMYDDMNNTVCMYAIDKAHEYDHFLKLNYEVIKTSDTITVSFKGLGYPDKGEGEPVPLDKDFVFDISRVNDGIEPQLIE